MSKKALRVQMFGGFSMYYGGEALVLNKIGSSKSVRLLQMLLLSRRGGISKSEIMDNLYGWNEKADGANRNKNLNNLIYRLKGQLAACGLPEQEYVEIHEGMCRFQSSMPLELDTEEFEQTIIDIKKSEAGGGKTVPLLSKANEMYCGELLPGNLTELWFFQKSNYYKEMYIFTVHELEREFIRTRDYKNRLRLYSRAAAIYPFENWQVRQIRCNLEVYRYDEAMDIYNSTMELYAREMGIPPAAEMQECFETFKLIDENHSRDTGDPHSWQSMDKAFLEKKADIKRTLLEEEDSPGAYYCAYPSFVDYCHLVGRARERNTFHAVLMFLTLSRKGKRDNGKPENLPGQMELLKTVIGDSLRTGDAYTRYGNRHFILMLIKTDMDACSGIFRRVETAYAKSGGKGELWYYADMTQRLEQAAH